MDYELFLRRDAPLVEADLAAIDKRAAAHGHLHLALFRDAEGRPLGLDLGIAVGLAGGGEAVCALAFELADTFALAIYDPQLGRTLERGCERVVSQSYERTSAFAEAALVGQDARPAGTRASARIWLTIGGAATLLLIGARLVSCCV